MKWLVVCDKVALTRVGKQLSSLLEPVPRLSQGIQLVAVMRGMCTAHAHNSTRRRNRRSESEAVASPKARGSQISHCIVLNGVELGFGVGVHCCRGS